MTETWHAPEDLLARFVVDPSAVDPRVAGSLEAHLVSCERCRSTLNVHVDGGVVERSWSAIEALIDEPRRSLPERVLGRVGVSDATARLLGATPALAAAGVVSVIVVVGFIVVASRVADAAGGFLVIAPVVPLLAVAATFAPATDPAGEAGVATPLHGIGLVLRRSAVVLSVVFVVLGIADVAIGPTDAPVVAWLAPSLALALGTLALATWFRAEVAAAALAATWVVVVTVTRWMEGRTAGFAESPVFGATGQLAALLAVVVAASVVMARRDRFETIGVFR